MNKWTFRLIMAISAAAAFHLAPKNEMDSLKGQFAEVTNTVKTAVGTQILVQEAHAGDNWIKGKVVSVSDGDTLTMLANGSKVTVRLLAIDAPEVTCHGQHVSGCREEGQRFGLQSKEYLSNSVLGETVEVRLNGEKTYDRQVGTVYYKSLDVNYALVQRGLAWHYKKFAKQQPSNEREMYAEAETTAQQQHLGIWSDASPIPPWQWRRH